MSSDEFVPADFDPPTSLVTDQFRLEPLGPQHNQADHAAWTSSIEHIRSTPGYADGTWPPLSGMTLEENLSDLRRHADDFTRGAGYTFTVLDPGDDDVIGCVYLYPSRSEASDVKVLSWVRADRSRLDVPLAEAVAHWLATDWPWERVDRSGTQGGSKFGLANRFPVQGWIPGGENSLQGVHVPEEAAAVTAHTVSVQGLIENVRAVMKSDTATLLLLDETGSVLEPAASAGLGRRWRGATHVPVGSGFAGRVVVERVPVVLNEVNEVSLLNPILRDFGVRRLLGVPVFGRTGLLGVLHVGCLMPRTFTPEDTRRLESAAAEIGERLSERTHDDAHLVALALQRSLLPAAPPSIEGLDIAVRYLPAEGDLGGDWYDIFTLPSGRVGLVMGDVEGHGLRSAVAMGRLRSALRAYALDYDDPAEVLHRLDRQLCYFESEISATVVYAVTDPPFDHVTISNAGHPAPLVTQRGRPFAEIADISHDLLLGLDPEHPRHSEKLPLTPGAALAFYTDGLVERRKEAGQHADPDVERLELVRRAFAASDNAETACSRIIAEGLGDDSVEDDVALVVVRRPG